MSVSPESIPGTVLKWGGIFLLNALVITGAGAVAGGAAFLLLGKLFMPAMSYAELSLTGLRVGGILAGVWAPGVSIVLCFVRGKKENDARAAEE